MSTAISVILIQSSELSQRWVSYYYMDELSQRFHFEYWDCSSFVFPSFKSSTKLAREYVVEIPSVAYLTQKLSLLRKDALIIDDIRQNAENFLIHKTISNYFPYRIYINFFSNTVYSESNIFQKIKSYFTFRKIKSKLYRICCNNLFEYTYYIACGQNNKYAINHPDYDEYINSIKKGSVSSEYSSNIVYIDNFFPFHPDIKEREPYLNTTKVAKDFFESLNLFFSKLEIFYGSKVVIAAHPTSHFETNPFDGREIIYNRTSELIKNSRVVCMHTSNALSYAILYDKPILLLTNNAYKSAKLEYKRLLNMSSLYKMPITDTNGNDISPKNVDKTIREKYIKQYLSAGQVNLRNIDILSTHFEQIHSEIILKI